MGIGVFQKLGPLMCVYNILMAALFLLGVQECMRHKRQFLVGVNQSGGHSYYDREIIRTKLPGGDVEELNPRAGIRKLICACGTEETQYRDRSGFRRITFPELVLTYLFIESSARKTPTSSSVLSIQILLSF